MSRLRGQLTDTRSPGPRAADHPLILIDDHGPTWLVDDHGFADQHFGACIAAPSVLARVLFLSVAAGMLTRTDHEEGP